MDICGGRKRQIQQPLGSTKEGKHSVCAAGCNVRCQDKSIYRIEARTEALMALGFLWSLDLVLKAVGHQQQ